MWLVTPLAIAIWLVAYRASSVIVCAHLAVAVEGVVGATRAIYGDKVVIHTQTIALCITIGEEAALQHLLVTVQFPLFFLIVK